MTPDPLAAAGLVAREVRTGERDGVPTRVVVARRAYPTDPAELWDALTDPERLPRWFLPVTGDLHEGGRYQVIGNAGGTVQRCTPPESFALTWEFGEMVSWLTISLSRAGEGTVLELEHEAAVDPGTWDRFGPGAVGVGWDLGLRGLGVHLDTGAAMDPAAGAAWPTTPEGTAYVEAAAAGWAEAAIADGDDGERARAAGAETLGFYTVAPEG